MSLSPYLINIDQPTLTTGTGHMLDISGNYGALSRMYGSYVNNSITFPNKLLDPDHMGKYDTIDEHGNLTYKYDNLTNPNPNLRDAMIQDNQNLISQQNTMYILGTITCVSLIITAIMISSKR